MIQLCHRLPQLWDAPTQTASLLHMGQLASAQPLPQTHVNTPFCMATGAPPMATSLATF
jgi:hypothetical protein